MTSLDLALVGNGTIGALIDAMSDVVWGCFPRFDGDPMFCGLLREAPPEDGAGVFRVTLDNVVRDEQEYLVNTPVLVTRLYDKDGGARSRSPTSLRAFNSSAGSSAP